MRSKPFLDSVGAWDFSFDFTSNSNLYQDAALTTPVTAAGQSVKGAIDTTGNALALRWGSATDCTWQQDSEGVGYLDVPSGANLRTDPIGLRLPAYLGVAIASDDESTTGSIVGLSADDSNGVFIRRKVDARTFNAEIKKTGISTGAVQGRNGTSSLGTKTVIDVTAQEGEVSSRQNNGALERPDVNEGGSLGGLRTMPTTWGAGDRVDGARLCIAHTGAAASNVAVKVYAVSVRQNATIDRDSMNAWLMAKAGLDDLYTQTYDLFGVAGQSNGMGASGDTGYVDSTAVPFGEAVEYIDDGSLKPLADPTQHGRLTDSSLTGSAWPSFSKTYFDETGRRSCIVGGAASGIGLLAGGWADNSYVEFLADKMLAAKALIEAGGGSATIRGVFWCGGENDTGSLRDVEDYAAELVDLRDRFRAALGMPAVPLLILSLDNSPDPSLDANYEAIRNAQVLAATEEGVELVMPFQDFEGQGKLLPDPSVHWNQTALNEAGAIAAVNTAAAF